MTSEGRVKVEIFGGGTGQSVILRGIKDIDAIELGANCTVTDNGGSTKWMDDNLQTGGGIGDVAHCIAELSRLHPDFLEVLTNRVPETSNVNLAVKNSVLAPAVMKWNWDEAVRRVSGVFQLDSHHHVRPVAFGRSSLKAMVLKREDHAPTGNPWDKNFKGHEVVGETEISEELRNGASIKNLAMEPPLEANPQVIEGIKTADYIVLPPGSLHESIFASLTPLGIRTAIRESKAKIIIFLNLTMAAAPYYENAEHYIELLEGNDGVGRAADFIFVSSHAHFFPKEMPSKDTEQGKYYQQIASSLLRPTGIDLFNRGIPLPFLSTDKDGNLCHSPQEVKKAFLDILEGRLLPTTGDRHDYAPVITRQRSRKALSA